MYRSITERLIDGRDDGTLRVAATDPHEVPERRESARAALALRSKVQPTPSTRQLRADLAAREAEVIDQDAPHNLRAAYYAARHAYIFTREHPHSALKYEARKAMQTARAAALEAGAKAYPWGARFVAEARARLAQRLTEIVTARRVWLEAPTRETLTDCPLPLIMHDDLGPPGPDLSSDALARRANLTFRPAVERLTAALALAPGAPQRAVCV